MANAMDSEARKSPLRHTHSFRVNDQIEEELLRQLKQSGLTISEWMRDAVLSNKTQIIARPRASVDVKRLIFLANKTSNNINQLAHRANAAHLAGKISDPIYEAILNELSAVVSHMNRALEIAD